MRRVDLHNEHGGFLLVVRPLISAGLGANPGVEAAAVRHQDPAQSLYGEPAALPLDEREALPGRGAVDQRLGGLSQVLVLYAKPLDLATRAPEFDLQLGIRGPVFAVRNSLGYERRSCRSADREPSAVAELCHSDRPSYGHRSAIDT